MAITNIQINRGDSFSRPISLKNSSGVGIDITSYKFYFTVKSIFSNVRDDSDAVIKKDITIFSNPTGGEFMLDLTSVETDVQPGNYQYSFQYKKPDGSIHSINERPLFDVLADGDRRTD